MKICYYMFVCDEDFGECYAFFELDKKGRPQCIHWFDCNDAVYRNEYMNGLLKHFSVDMRKVAPANEKACMTALKKVYSI